METDWKKNVEKFRKFNLLFSRPAQVQIDITNKCNLNCLYCYNKNNSLNDEELSDGQLRQVTSKIINELNPLYVSFSGGEPLLRSELLMELIKRLKDKNIGVHINTNSLLMTENIAKKLGELKVDKININIDSLTCQDKLRGGKDLLKKTFNSLEILKKYFPKDRISIACVITRLNYRNCLEIAKFVKKEGLMEIHLLDMIPCEKSSMNLFLSKTEWVEFFKIYRKIKDMGVKIKPNHALLFLGEFENQVKIPFCMAGRFKMVITAGGKIVPCNYFKTQGFICGDALKENLAEVWRNSEIMNEFRYFIPKEEKCQKCKLINLCTGGCRAMSLKISGDAFKADPYCLNYNLRDETK